MSKLSRRILEARKRVGLSQEALALELNVSRSAVAQWEMEHGTVPAVENLIALARRTGMRFEYLATGRGDKVFGAPIPALDDERATYDALSEQQIRLLECFDALSTRQRGALLELLGSGGTTRRARRRG